MNVTVGHGNAIPAVLYFLALEDDFGIRSENPAEEDTLTSANSLL